jgi:carbon-monoxide dehydrogenase large subunit
MMPMRLGAAVPRSEDLRLLTGQGRYTADMALPGQIHAVFLRSPHGHAAIQAIDLASARSRPGVEAVLTGADVAADALGPIPCAVPVKDRNGHPLPQHGRPLLAGERVRFVGEPVAMVVARSRLEALDALDRIRVDYRALPAVATIAEAMAPEAPTVWSDAPGNSAFFWELGDEEKVADAFRRADRIFALDVVNNRVVPCPIEPRAVLGAFDPPTGRYTLHTSSQGGHLIRDLIAQHTLKVRKEDVRVVIGDVGGGFGTKFFHYPEEALALWAAKRLGHPVRWVGDRLEAFTGDTHGRDQENHGEAAFDRHGRLLALRVRTVANMGAYLGYFAPAIPSAMTGCMLSGVYAVPLIHATCQGVYTNTLPVDAYRGAGRPEAAYLIERLMDEAARDLGLAPDEIRRRNFIRPEAMPYATASGCTYDSGDFARNLEDALEAARWDEFPARRAEARARGRLRGIGLSTYIEVCGYDAEEATLRFSPEGRVELLIGTQSTGQGHATAYAQIVAERLGIPFDAVDVVQGDTDRIPFGKGTAGSRSLPVGGPAVYQACNQVIERGTTFARHLLQAANARVTFADGTFRVEGTDRTFGLFELARAVRDPDNLPPGERTASLDSVARYSSQGSTFPNGCHIAEVEIDPETGACDVAAYHVVDDFGTVVNPLLLEGQVHGGVAQGIGQALIERIVYEPGSAQLLTASFADYGIPLAQHVPPFTPSFNPVPCRTNPLGIKGAGEAGAIAACPAVINAVLDALSPLGVRQIDMPATPETIWRAITAAAAPHPDTDQELEP